MTKGSDLLGAPCSCIRRYAVFRFLGARGFRSFFICSVGWNRYYGSEPDPTPTSSRDCR